MRRVGRKTTTCTIKITVDVVVIDVNDDGGRQMGKKEKEEARRPNELRSFEWWNFFLSTRSSSVACSSSSPFPDAVWPCVAQFRPMRMRIDVVYRRSTGIANYVMPEKSVDIFPCPRRPPPSVGWRKDFWEIFTCKCS